MKNTTLSTLLFSLAMISSVFATFAEISEDKVKQMKNQCKLAYDFLSEELDEQNAVSELKKIQNKYFKLQSSENKLTEQLVEFFNHEFKEYTEEDEQEYKNDLEKALKDSLDN
jgi:predicted transcriptional regulator